MSVVAGKTFLPFEPKMPVPMDTVAQTDTPENMRPTLGALSQLTYKPTTWRYMVKMSAAASQGTAEITLLAGATVIRTDTYQLSGLFTFSNQVPVDLSQVQGEQPLSTRVNVTAAADAEITATVDSVVDVETPLSVTGC